MTTTTKPNHIGRKIARIRELRGMKQETLAEELGISQQSVSSLEKSETLEDEKLESLVREDQSLHMICRSLLRASHLGGGRDNCTIMLMQV